ncbi:hypothetical protein B0H13DRAFT_803926 [Mycena leptocephala]|nr:hypothetical protein B0H13DRAFT_803926 [Mycena leptocephala]
MPKNAQHKQAIAQVKAVLVTPAIVGRIESLLPDSSDAVFLLNELSTIHSSLTSVQGLLDFISNSMPAEIQHCTSLGRAYSSLKQKQHKAKAQARLLAGVADHRERRNMIRSLGIMGAPRTLQDIIATQTRSDVGTLGNPKIVRRARTPLNDPEAIGPRRFLADTKCRPDPDVIVDSAHGFYEVQTHESVIFVSPDSNNIELVVLRNVGSETPPSKELYDWLAQVVVTACIDRRNVRPTHPGTLVQVGWNAGPRHARVFGLAKSYNRVMDQATAADHDGDVIAAMTLTWSVCRALLPTDVITEIDGYLELAGLPQMATRQVPEGECIGFYYAAPVKLEYAGQGYRFVINGKTFDFPAHERPPSEGLLSQDYSAWSHIDPAWAKWGLSWNVAHEVDAPERRPPTVFSAGVSPITTRSRAQIAAQNTPVVRLAEDPSLWPAEGGGNFVDVSLKVKVKQSSHTLMAFRPEFMHGTTRLCGAHSMGCTIPFCTRVLEAYNRAKAGTSVESGEGVGHNS